MLYSLLKLWHPVQFEEQLMNSFFCNPRWTCDTVMKSQSENTELKVSAWDVVMRQETIMYLLKQLVGTKYQILSLTVFISQASPKTIFVDLQASGIRTQRDGTFLRQINSIHIIQILKTDTLLWGWAVVNKGVGKSLNLSEALSWLTFSETLWFPWLPCIFHSFLLFTKVERLLIT